MGWVSKAGLWQEAKLRILGLALVGSLALIVPIAARSAPPGSNTGQAITGPTQSGLIQVGDGRASNGRPAVEVGARRIGDRAVSMAVVIAGQQFPTTISGFPEAQSLTIPSRIGEARPTGGVIRSRSVRSPGCQPGLLAWQSDSGALLESASRSQSRLGIAIARRASATEARIH